MKTVAIVQSSYIPWKGYFDLIGFADEFILLDDVQFTRRDWRNRNRIKTPQGVAWLTIPVEVKGRYHQTIAETRIADSGWAGRHLKALRQSYGRAPHFEQFEPLLERLYSDAARTHLLSEVNRSFIEEICRVLKIDTPIRSSSTFALTSGATERLVSICVQAGATRYLSGPSAQAYLDEELFRNAGVEVGYIDYTDYAEYRQLYPPFTHTVSIVDLLVHTGLNASRYLKSS